jgi:radical SAM protein with 4Fe4S-binding SPASM domain
MRFNGVELEFKMNSEIKLPKFVKRIVKNEKVLFINPIAPEWVVTNKNGAIALKMCDGKRSINNIADIFGSKYGTEFIPDVTRFLNEVSKSNLFLHDSEIPKSRLSNYKLRILQLSLTDNCNLKCKYCYATDRIELGPDILSFAEYKSIIDQAISISTGLQLILTGGEPLLNKDCFKIAEYANKLNCRVHLLTNGTLIDDSNISKIKDLFYLVKVSVDGSTKELHELHRGTNSYEHVTNAISLLDSFKINYQISMTVNKNNIHDVSAMATKYGSKLTYQPLFNAGRAKKGSTCITGKEYYKALANCKGVNPLSELESALENAKRDKILKCAVGDAELSISPTGDIYPCQLLHDKKFYAGNIRDQPLIDIYNHSKVILDCRKLTVDNLKGCSRCFIRYICGGACRARAFYECGNICTSGKFCEYEKIAFVNGIFNLYSKNALK